MPGSANTAASLLIRPDRIGPSGLTIEATLDAERLSVLKEMADAGECAFPAPIAVSLAVHCRDRHISVQGRFETRVHLPCSRCLKPVKKPLSADFRYTYAPPDDDRIAFATEDAIELAEEDAERMIYTRDEIDLSEAVQEEVIAALPYRILCRDDCKGLCPGCGADRNLAPCPCETHSVDPRLAILKTLKDTDRTDQ